MYKLQTWIVNRWYSSRPIKWLIPFSWLFRLIVNLRSRLYQQGWLRSYRFSMPVIVVGNITVGGSGKTPTVMALITWLQQQGYKPGVVSRGYGATRQRQPALVTADSLAHQVSDEAVLLAQTLSCPVVVCTDRVKAMHYLKRYGHCDVIVSDDGLQQYRLVRDIEIIALDGQLRLGNEYCLPAGPLREPKQRLSQADFIVAKGRAMVGEYLLTLQSHLFCSLKNSQQRPRNVFAGQTVHAVAGIGHPRSFFQQLRELGMTVIEHAFPDHYLYQQADIYFNDDYPVIMTAKDATKCRKFANDQHWYLSVIPQLESAFWTELSNKLR